MRKPEYRRALRTAQDDLERLYSQREDLERKIARLRETVINLHLMLEIEHPAMFFSKTLTSAVQDVIVATTKPLEPRHQLTDLFAAANAASKASGGFFAPMISHAWSMFALACFANARYSLSGICL